MHRFSSMLFRMVPKQIEGLEQEYNRFSAMLFRIVLKLFCNRKATKPVLVLYCLE